MPETAEGPSSINPVLELVFNAMQVIVWHATGFIRGTLQVTEGPKLLQVCKAWSATAQNNSILGKWYSCHHRH